MSNHRLGGWKSIYAQISRVKSSASTDLEVLDSYQYKLKELRSEQGRIRVHKQQKSLGLQGRAIGLDRLQLEVYQPESQLGESGR